jgi:hypothetical protein
LALAERLINKGADVNKPGWTALHYAGSKGHTDMIRLLLDQQAYLDAESPNRTTPLMMAARYGNSKTVKLLLEEGADPRIRNKQGLSALEFANQSDKEESSQYVKAFLNAWNHKYSQAPEQLAQENEAKNPVSEIVSTTSEKNTPDSSQTVDPPQDAPNILHEEAANEPQIADTQSDIGAVDSPIPDKPVSSIEDDAELEVVTGPALPTNKYLY